MNIFLKLTVLFCIGSLAGWIIELLFRRFFSNENADKKWVNPGFLKGPYLPLYGAGACTLYLLSRLGEKDIFNGVMGIALLTMLMTTVLTLLEYITGYVFVIRLNVPLWDYSNERGNIQGIICPRFSLFWAVASVIYYFFLDGLVARLLPWFASRPILIFALGSYFGVFCTDLIFTLERRFDLRRRIVNAIKGRENGIRRALGS